VLVAAAPPGPDRRGLRRHPLRVALPPSPEPRTVQREGRGRARSRPARLTGRMERVLRCGVDVAHPRGRRAGVLAPGLPVKTLTGILLLAGCALGVAASDGKLRVLEQDRPVAHHLLYLPNGREPKLGTAPLAADLIYLWSIQFYGDYQAEDRYQYVQHIYGNVITELDPHYFDPYWIGALILSVETHDLDKALALLDKGFANTPDRWIYPYLAGWECSYARQYDRAAAYFRKAAAVPSSPPDVERLVAGMDQKQGGPQTAPAGWA